jgi:hypothetical protein
MTEQEYLDKLDGVAYLLEAWGQAARVSAFLREPARSRRGLPGTPMVGNAVSIQLEVSAGVLEEYFPR